jgi:hypothetical protein
LLLRELMAEKPDVVVRCPWILDGLISGARCESVPGH